MGVIVMGYLKIGAVIVYKLFIPAPQSSFHWLYSKLCIEKAIALLNLYAIKSTGFYPLISHSIFLPNRFIMKTILLFAAILFFGFFVTAQTPELVKNINTQDQGTGLGSDHAVMGNSFYFGSEKKIWKTDGTAAGTSAVKDFSGLGATAVSRFIAAGSYVYFYVALNGSNQMWRTDGTEAGTILLKDFGTNAVFFHRAALGNWVLFNAAESSTGSELWKSDGTVAGTVLVKDINPGTAGSSAGNMKNINGVLFFSAFTSTGTGLWKSDGTEAGTVLIKDLDPLSNNGAINDLMTAAGNKAFFYFETAATGRELWVSDGTDAGTFMVKDIYPGSTGGFPNNLTALGNKLCFVAQDALNRQVWITDGTEAGTVPLFDVLPNSRNDSYNYFSNCNGTLYFSATTGIAFSAEPYISDGTPAGTMLLKDINPGPNGSDARGYKYFNGKTYFIANSPGTGYELWSSDGTEAGTALFTEIYPGINNGIGGSYLIEAVLSNRFIFSGNHPDYREEPFSSDGTIAGTQLIRNIQTTGLGSFPLNLTPVGNRLYFSGTLQFSDTEPWYADGTPNGVQLLKDAEPAGYSKPFEFTNIDNTNFYFRTINAFNSRDIYKSDGTAAGTNKIVTDITSDRIVPIGNILLFGKRDATNGTELWKYENGVTSLVKNINAGVSNSFPGNFIAFNNQVFFYAEDGINGNELWKTDGTEAGTQLVADINPGAAGSGTYTNMVVLNNNIYTLAVKGGNLTLIKTDGTASGTLEVKSFTDADEAAVLYVFNNMVYFIKKNTFGSQVNEELWKTDGTEAGTALVKEIFPYTATSSGYIQNISFYTHNNRFYFYVDSENLFGETGKLTLWCSDGSTDGTIAIKTAEFAEDEEPDIEDGINYIAAYDNNEVLFVSADAATGMEIWKTDGTGSGTSLVSDLNPGPSGSSPGGLINFANAVYFSANDGTDLNELWKINMGGVVPLKLLSFTANRQNKTVQLQWRTENEINSSHFEVERSTDGRNFTNIGNVTATGRNTNNYSTRDELPVSGVNYYRLKMMDKDGAFSYSQTVKVNFLQGNSITVQPNPAKDFITITTAEQYKSLRLVDMNGKEVMRFEKRHDNRYNISGAAKGIYLLQLLGDEIMTVKKIVIE